MAGRTTTIYIHTYRHTYIHTYYSKFLHQHARLSVGLAQARRNYIDLLKFGGGCTVAPCGVSVAVAEPSFFSIIGSEIQCHLNWYIKIKHCSVGAKYVT